MHVSAIVQPACGGVVHPHALASAPIAPACSCGGVHPTSAELLDTQLGRIADARLGVAVLA
jgi:hypothetical protein